MLHRHTNAHLGDLEDGDRLLGTLSMCQQQVQSSISIKVGHGTTCSEQNIFIASYTSSTGEISLKNEGNQQRNNLKMADRFLAPVARQHRQHSAPRSQDLHLPSWKP